MFVLLILFSTYSLFAQEEVPEKKLTPRQTKELQNNKNQQTTSEKQQNGKRTSLTESDSSKSSTPFAKRDTIITQPVNSQVYWYDMENKIQTRKDFASSYAYHMKDEKKLMYRNMSDIFRQQPMWYVYNLMESGRPTYLSGINTYPHQTSFYYNNVLMNDPIHGMFNSQYIPVNYIRNVQLSSVGNNLQDYGVGGTSGIHVTSSSRHTKAPWSKILYKQGNYGYSDLDLSFVHPASPDIAVQLGGINRVFDGLGNLYSNRHGTNYRGELTWQLKNNIYFSAQFFLNRERVGLTPLMGGLSSPVFPKQIDLRDDYFINFTWLPTDTITQRLNLKLFNTYSIRRLKDNYSQSYHNRYQFKRYGFDANYNFKLGEFDFLAGGGSLWNRVWGTGFNKQYFPIFYNTYGKLIIPLYAGISVKPQVQFTFDKNFNPQISLSAMAQNSIDLKHHFSLGAARSTRYPNATELYFNFDSLSNGNPNLLNEDHISGYINYKTKLFSDLELGMSGQYNLIMNEITFINETFSNNADRDYLVIAGGLRYSLWKFDAEIGGFETFSDFYLTPRRSGWLKLHFADIWLNKALGVDAYSTIQYWGHHNVIEYEPRIERFYAGQGIEDDYFIINWKIVVTVQDARIFFEMDNSLSEEYEVINHFAEFTQRWRFGVHWILWD